MRFVPSRSLLRLAACALPLSALALVSREATALAGGIYALLAIFAAIDLWRALGRPPRWTTVGHPSFRFARGREDVIEVKLEGITGSPAELTAGLDFPVEMVVEKPLQTVALARGQASVRFRWKVTVRARGVFTFSELFLQYPSPARLWDLRAGTPLHCEVRVYPNLRTQRQAFANLFLRRGLAGSHLVRQVGKGREFEKLREYQPGDTYDDISWKATAKRGFPVTREMQVERTQELYLVIDASRLSGRPVGLAEDGSEVDTMLESFVTMAALMGMAAEAQGDLFGVATFSRGLDRLILARGGRGQRNLVQEALFSLQTSRVTPDFGSIFASLRGRLRRRALLLFLSDLRDPVLAEGFLEHGALLGRHHLCMVNTVRPPEAVPLFRRKGAPRSEDEAYTQVAGHLTWTRLRELETSLRQVGFGFAMPRHEELAVSLINQYLEVKQRQAL